MLKCADNTYASFLRDQTNDSVAAEGIDLPPWGGFRAPQHASVVSRSLGLAVLSSTALEQGIVVFLWPHSY